MNVVLFAPEETGGNANGRDLKIMASTRPLALFHLRKER